MIIEDPHLPDNKIRIVVGPTQAKRLAETTRSTAQSADPGLWDRPGSPSSASTPVSGSNARMRTPDPTPTG